MKDPDTEGGHHPCDDCNDDNTWSVLVYSFDRHSRELLTNYNRHAPIRGDRRENLSGDNAVYQGIA